MVSWTFHVESEAVSMILTILPIFHIQFQCMYFWIKRNLAASKEPFYFLLRYYFSFIVLQLYFNYCLYRTFPHRKGDYHRNSAIVFFFWAQLILADMFLFEFNNFSQDYHFLISYLLDWEDFIEDTSKEFEVKKANALVF